MKKIIGLIAVLMMLVMSFGAYPYWHGLNDPAYTHAVNGNVNLNNKTVDVMVYQWISATFVSRGEFRTARGAQDLQGNPLTDGILITKPGLINDVLLGGIALYSNGNVDITVGATSNYAPAGKTNMNDKIKELKLKTYNSINNQVVKFTKSIVDADPLAGYSVSNETKIAKVSNLTGNSNNGKYGPEFAILADIDVPNNFGPGDDYIISLDISVAPKTKF